MVEKVTEDLCTDPLICMWSHVQWFWLGVGIENHESSTQNQYFYSLEYYFYDIVSVYRC